MDDYSARRGIDRFAVPRKSSGIILRDAAEDRGQFCNRLGCKGRLNHTKSSPSGCLGKCKSSKTLTVNASNGKEVVSSSTSTRSVITGNPREAVERSQRTPRCSKSETDSSESSSSSLHQDKRRDSESGKVASVVELGGSSVSSPNGSSNQKKVYRPKSGIGAQSASMGSSDVIASKSKITNQGTRISAANTSRHGLRSLRCNSISDVLPSGSSSSNSKYIKRKDVHKKRNSEIESSPSSQSKKLSGPSSEDRGYSPSGHGIHISDSRRERPIQSQRSISGNNTRTRQFLNSGSRMEFPAVTPQSESSIAMELPFVANRFPNEASSSTQSMPFSRPGSSGWDLFADNFPLGPGELGIPNPSLNLEGLRRHNIDGIAEVLLAVEQIEQDDELTYEQLMTLDANLFLDALGFYDQHREMRLDIDNMSYEELLVLEEKMGNVSTALSEAAIAECLRISIFQPRALGEQSMRGSEGDDNEVKCCICQEEYVVEDEVGRMKCEHGYHKACIQQWLHLKNWCPICKAPAAAPSPPA